jgi:hypothetical protein
MIKTKRLSSGVTSVLVGVICALKASTSPIFTGLVESVGVLILNVISEAVLANGFRSA